MPMALHQHEDFKAAKQSVQPVAARLGLRVQRSMMSCPNKAAHAHGDRRPSAKLSAFSWKCFTCGEHGDAVDLVRITLGMTHLTALEWLRGDLTAPEQPRRVERTRPRIDGDATKVLASLWAILRSDALMLDLAADRVSFACTGSERQWVTPAFVDWCHSRGLLPRAVLAIGCRDLWPYRSAITELVNRSSEQDLLAAGFATAGDDGMRLWGPIYGLKARRENWRGLMIPIWDGLNADYPVAYRFRPYQATSIKSMAQPRSTHDVIGLQLIGPQHRRVIICEGEPDWLTLIQSKTGCDTATVALCAVSRHVDGELSWVKPLLNAEQITVAIHAHGEETDKFCTNLARVLVLHNWRGDLRRYCPDETGDLNDMLRRYNPVSEWNGELIEPRTDTLQQWLHDGGWTQWQI